MRSGLVTGVPDAEVFDMTQTISGAEAAVMLQNALDLSGAAEAVTTDENTAPQWAADALQVLGEHGVILDAERDLTRADAAQVIYQVAQLAPDAPGTIALRMAQ